MRAGRDLRPDRVHLLAALTEQWSAVETLVHDLTAPQWLLPTPCPAWDVRDQIAHIVAAEYALAGHFGTPGVTPDSELYAAAGMFMVDVREESPRALLDRYRDITAERLAALADLSDEQWADETWTPVGPGTVHRLVRLRVFDCWMHEQDIRDAVNRPGHESGAAPEIVLDEIGAALGWLLAKQAQVPAGSVVTMHARGELSRTWHVVVDGRAHLVSEAPRQPDVTLTLPTGTLTRLCGGRIDPATASVRIAGNADLGVRIVAHLRFTT
jgi:uncharacterized protein (TIGR03083 family)